MPSALTEIISFNVAHDDSITLRLYQKPTIVYDIDPPGTATTININGNIISVFPYSETVFIDDLNTISSIIDSDYGFKSWGSNYNSLLNGNSINNSFYGIYNDTIVLYLTSTSAFIAGNDTICKNAKEKAEVSVSFTGVSPFTFSFKIDGVIQPTVITTINPYIITTKIGGNYSLFSYNDANEFGKISGQAIVTILPEPIAQFNPQPDSMTILYTTTQLIDRSEGSIASWQWDFGDNTPPVFSENPYHTYKDSIAIYQISLIVKDNKGCLDTSFKHVQITDDYWIYIPTSFTPDKDGLNDKFCISYNGIRSATFNFNVYDKFSNLVFTTNNIYDLSSGNGWDGTHYKTGNKLPSEMYIYQIYYQDFNGWKHQETSELIIIR